MISRNVDFIQDEFAWPFLASGICGLCPFLFSSTAHCIQSKSELVHYVAFMVDYSGIGLLFLGGGLAHFLVLD